MKKEDMYAIFRLDDEYYGIHIEEVISIETLGKVTRVPNTDKHVRGLMNLRGNVLTLIDLQDKIEIGKGKDTNSTRVVIVANDELSLGLVVDSLREVREISKDTLEPPPYDEEDKRLTYVKYIGSDGDKVVMILDTNKILEC